MSWLLKDFELPVVPPIVELQAGVTEAAQIPKEFFRKRNHHHRERVLRRQMFSDTMQGKTHRKIQVSSPSVWLGLGQILWSDLGLKNAAEGFHGIVGDSHQHLGAKNTTAHELQELLCIYHDSEFEFVCPFERRWRTTAGRRGENANTNGLTSRETKSKSWAAVTTAAEIRITSNASRGMLSI